MVRFDYISINRDKEMWNIDRNSTFRILSGEQREAEIKQDSWMYFPISEDASGACRCQ